MKRLLLISSVLVVMMCNIVFAAEFSIRKIDWSDTPEQVKEKLDVLGEYTFLSKIDEGAVTNFTTVFGPDENLNADTDNDYKELSDEEKSFSWGTAHMMRVREFKLEISNKLFEGNGEIRIYTTERTRELLGYSVYLPYRTKLNKINTNKQIKIHGNPDKLLGEYENKTIKWKKNGEIEYLNETDYSVTISIVNLDRLKKHAKKVKKEAKKEGIIK
jgi:hypothetical protein